MFNLLSLFINSLNNSANSGNISSKFVFIPFYFFMKASSSSSSIISSILSVKPYIIFYLTSIDVEYK